MEPTNENGNATKGESCTQISLYNNIKNMYIYRKSGANLEPFGSCQDLKVQCVWSNKAHLIVRQVSFKSGSIKFKKTI